MAPIIFDEVQFQNIQGEIRRAIADSKDKPGTALGALMALDDILTEAEQFQSYDKGAYAVF